MDAQRPERAAADEAMARYSAGEDAAFGTLYDALAPRLFAFFSRQGAAAGRAEDFVQQTFLQMHRARGSFSRGAAVHPWAYAIARRLLIDAARRDRTHPARAVDPVVLDETICGDGVSGEDALSSREMGTRLGAALAALPASQREAFELVKEEGLSCREAGDVLGISEDAAKLRSHRACLSLREALSGSWRRAGARA